MKKLSILFILLTIYLLCLSYMDKPVKKNIYEVVYDDYSVIDTLKHYEVSKILLR